MGRTGAGKSSITQAIFHLAIVDGVIEIDDFDLNSLGLHTFREKISMIPQDPILFVGSLRDNLDPLREKVDDELWQALEQVRDFSTCFFHSHSYLPRNSNLLQIYFYLSGNKANKSG